MISKDDCFKAKDLYVKKTTTNLGDTSKIVYELIYKDEVIARTMAMVANEPPETSGLFSSLPTELMDNRIITSMIPIKEVTSDNK